MIMEPKSLKLPEYGDELIAKVREIKSSLMLTDATPQKNDSKWNYLCKGKMQGGCIIFGGWLKVIPSSGNKYAYCAYGGLGIAGWNHECSIYSIYTNIEELYKSAISCMIVSGASLPDDPMIGAATDCVFYDKHSNMVGIASTEAGVAALVGGTVKWKNK